MYTVEVRNQFQALLDLDGSEDANQLYNNITAAHKEAARIHIPVKKKVKQHVPWENELVSSKREEVKKAFEETLARKTRSKVEKLEKAKKELQDAYDVEQENYVQEKVDTITNAAENQRTRLAWKTVNELTNRKGTNKGRIKAKSPQERIKKWQDHFVNLLGQPPVITSKPTKTIVEETLPICTENFSLEELVKCVEGFKNNKASGLDEIPIEVWKSGAWNTQLLEVCNKTLNGDKPDMWAKSGIVAVPKKGDLGLTTNYRGISLTATAAKIYNKMILERIRPHLDPILRINQNGFRGGRSMLVTFIFNNELCCNVRQVLSPVCPMCIYLFHNLVIVSRPLI